MWYMLLEPKLRIYQNLLFRPPVSGYVEERKGLASRWAIDSLLGRVWEKFNDSRLQRRAMQEFASLDDRLLRDIGMERDRIPEMVGTMLRNKPVARSGTSRSSYDSKKAGDVFPVRFWRSLLKAWLRRRAINDLARLDNRLLRDIGLDRDQIPDAVDAMLNRKPVLPPSATVHYLDVEEPEGDASDELPTRAAA